MTLHFVTTAIALSQPCSDLPQSIEATLQGYGEPLRWAITAVSEGQVWIEAVVLVE